MQLKTINRQIISILAITGFLAAIVIGWININSSKNSAIDDAAAKANELVGRTAQMFMVSTIRFNDEFVAANSAIEKEKVRNDWKRTIEAVDIAVTHDFGEKQSRVRLFTDEQLLNVPSLGKAATAATGKFENNSLKQFYSGALEPIVDISDDSYSLSVPLMSNMHPGCANCHGFSPSEQVLLGV